mmetsp:Transcript_12555/g.37060  ORF Transcript_12555/g.37060 Transcript_12555/m.37060 type:complete len:128 (-) Transcript_12555:203-586(-)
MGRYYALRGPKRRRRVLPVPDEASGGELCHREDAQEMGDEFSVRTRGRGFITSREKENGSKLNRLALVAHTNGRNVLHVFLNALGYGGRETRSRGWRSKFPTHVLLLSCRSVPWENAHATKRLKIQT